MINWSSLATQAVRSTFVQWLVVLCTVGPVVGGLAATTAGAPWTATNIFTIMLVPVGLSVLLVSWMSWRVRALVEENVGLREVARALYKINWTYRQGLSDAFHGSAPVVSSEERQLREKQVLERVCGRVAELFTILADRECTVTVKLLVPRREGEGRWLARTYARSGDGWHRDSDPEAPTDFNVEPADNLGFTKALQRRSDDTPRHFFSSDLTVENGYTNQRNNWQQYYKSAIVVPIQSSADNQPEQLGFLCVDEKGTNRLNGDDHVYMMAALAQQMFNFMALMRGKYTVAALQGGMFGTTADNGGNEW